jgi:hypothetical protein
MFILFIYAILLNLILIVANALRLAADPCECQQKPCGNRAWVYHNP